MKPNDYLLINRGLLYRNYWKRSSPEEKSILIVIIVVAEIVSYGLSCDKTIPREQIQVKTSYDDIAMGFNTFLAPKKLKATLEKFAKYKLLTYKESEEGLLIDIYDLEVFRTKNQLRKAREQS